MHPMLAGAVAGFVATVPMTIAMKFLQQELPGARRQPLPPYQITRALAARLGVAQRMDERERLAASAAAHFGFGGAAGAAYGLARERLGPALVGGVGFGLAVWAASYLGWLPAAGLLRPATREHRHRNETMLASHVVWGAATALLARKLAPPRPAKAPPQGR